MFHGLLILFLASILGKLSKLKNKKLWTGSKVEMPPLVGLGLFELGTLLKWVEPPPPPPHENRIGVSFNLGLF